MSPTQAVAYALGDDPPSAVPAGSGAMSGRPGPAAARAPGLTARETEVLRLLAGGWSNRGIAADLVLSVRTVERHVANLYAKARVHNRAEATGYAARHGLLAPPPPPRG